MRVSMTLTTMLVFVFVLVLKESSGMAWGTAQVLEPVKDEQTMTQQQDMVIKIKSRTE